MEEAVLLKGIKDGIMIIFGEAEEDIIIEETLKKAEEVISLFTEGSKIVFSGKELSEEGRVTLEKKLLDIIENEVSIEYDTEEFKKFFENFIEEPEDKSVFHYGTVRSGQEIKSSGNLIVVGDVNPGALLAAEGNIFVMGILRGTVHAGCSGDKTAVICASKMQPTQIRIADIISRPPEGEIHTDWIPEMAYVKDSNIYIDNYLAKNKK